MSAAAERAREDLPPVAAEVADLLLVLLRVEGASGRVELEFTMDELVPRVKKVWRHDAFGRTELARFDKRVPTRAS